MESILLIPMRFIFRADASREIGSGHVMRSSVLAEEAISRGFECIFLGEISDLSWVTQRISSLGFVQILTKEQDFVPNAESDVLILDSYSIPVSNTFIAKKNWKLVVTICDEITPRFVADIELRPGLASTGGFKMKPIVLSGPDYLLIRNGIMKSEKCLVSESPIKVIVVGGGSDSFGFVKAISDNIRSLNLDLKVHLFTNDEILSGTGVDFVIHPIGFELDQVSNDVDVALTTASTSSMEFIAREIPTGVACAVENQQDYYDQLGRLGYASQIGSRRADSGWEFDLKAIDVLLRSQHKRNLLKESIAGLVDLKGAARVMDTLILLFKNS